MGQAGSKSLLVIIQVVAILLVTSGCGKQIQLDNIETPATVVEADKVFANIFAPLDGTWEGQFQIYEDQSPKVASSFDLDNLNWQKVKMLNIKLVNEINVKQVYKSETPYFQRVEITDFYPQENRTEKSQGVNKIQNGEMWCVVHKPKEVIIHKGATKGKHTIIWQSNTPEKLEYFQETVESSTYDILGYGYYEGDDRNLTPSLWFYGRYVKK